MTVVLYGYMGIISLPCPEPPLTHDLNAGESWGLEYPDISGWRSDRGYWAVWDRHTGEVIAMAWPEPNAAGWDHFKYRIRAYSEPPSYSDGFNPFILDEVS